MAFKTIKYIIDPKKVLYLQFRYSHIESYRCRKLQRYERSHKRHDLPLDDSISLSIEMVEISRLEVMILSLRFREQMEILEILTP